MMTYPPLGCSTWRLKSGEVLAGEAGLGARAARGVARRQAASQRRLLQRACLLRAPAAVPTCPVMKQASWLARKT